MNFDFTDKQRVIQRVAREFTEREIEPIAEQVDRDCVIPFEMIKKMAQVGLFGMKVPPKYGGSEAGTLAYTLAMEQLGYAASACDSIVLTNNNLTELICAFGTEQQKQKYVPQLCAGEGVASRMFTEPSTGSDPKAIATTAVPDKDHYIINGNKRFATHSPLDGPAIIYAKDETGRVSAFLIEKNCEGYSTSKPWDLLGLRGQMTADVTLNNVRVPKNNLFGPKGDGMKILFSMIGAGRIGICARLLGLCQAARDEAIKYAKQRTVRDRPIAQMQTIQWLLSEIESRLEAARWLTYRVAFLAEQGEPPREEGAIAKLFVSRTAVEISNMALQVHGGYGYTKEFKVERIYRNAKYGEIVEGVSEIQRSIIASALI
ncbi:acyl-CoA dehydrogenase family protein [Chloroflexota bacterium]